MLLLRDGDIVPTLNRALITHVAVPAAVSLSIMRHNSKPYASQPRDEKRFFYFWININILEGTAFSL